MYPLANACVARRLTSPRRPQQIPETMRDLHAVATTALLCLAAGASSFAPPAPAPRGGRTAARAAAAAAAAPPADAAERYGTTVGDTRGAALRLEHVAISRGGTPLLADIDWGVQPGERWGIVGVNGAGKSTLLGAITGTVRMDRGAALVHATARVGYMRQTAVAGSTRTVYEEAKSEMAVVEEAGARLAAATRVVEDGDYSEGALDALADAQETFEQLGGYEQEQRVESVLKGLGFEPEDSDQLCSSFSGGWQMRIGLARLLLSAPSLLLLDEPSNHLDSAARDWLGKYIAQYDGSVVLVSHDVGLMDASVNNIVEITAGTLIEYKVRRSRFIHTESSP